jgi:hypothetical protein
MGENPCFTYWTVECKTEGCGNLILEVIGRCDLRRVVFLLICRDFEVTCIGCMKTYTYSREDVHPKNLLREPTLADRNSSFQHAIRPEPHQDAEAD